MSVYNIIIVASNLSAYYPMKIAYEKNDYKTLICIGFVASASFVSHLFQSHKHKQIGFGTRIQTSKLLNWVDIFGCAVIVLRLCYLFYNSRYQRNIIRKLLIPLLFCIGLNLISEKTSYPIIHSLWHISIFIWMGSFQRLIAI